MIGPEKRFMPAMAVEVRDGRVAAWAAALAKV